MSCVSLWNVSLMMCEWMHGLLPCPTPGSPTSQVTELLQTLLLMYHCGPATRRKMNAPPADTVDYRAACFCHRTLVDMASVCSNCLSVYCKAVPLCTTCNVIFQTDRPLVRLNKKKK